MIRRSIKERRHAIPDDYIVFLQEHEDDIGLTKDDPINFCQAMQSSNSQKWIDAMKDKIKPMQDNDIWDFVELSEGVKPIGCKWLFKTKKDSKGYIERLPVNGITNSIKSLPHVVLRQMYLSDLRMQHWKINKVDG
ncbi:hypothetical protein CR513_07571, partial [Mucuna pruriens]